MQKETYYTKRDETYKNEIQIAFLELSSYKWRHVHMKRDVPYVYKKRPTYKKRRMDFFPNDRPTN